MAVVANHKPPTVDENVSWDATKAESQLKKWATNKDGDIDFKKYKQGFAWYDENNPEVLASYKLPHHYVENGKLVTVWKGVAAAGAAIMGSRGGVNIPKDEIDKVKKHLEVHYKQFDKTPPWVAKENYHTLNLLIEAKELTGRKVEAVLIKAGMTANGEYIPAEVLEKAVDKFKQVPIGAYKVIDSWMHNPFESIDAVLNIVGFTTKKIRFENDAIIGEIEFHNEDIKSLIKNAIEQGITLGLSIVAYADGDFIDNVFKISEIKEIQQIDIVSFPAAGGYFTKILESNKFKEGSNMEMEKILEKLKEMGIELNDELKSKVEEMAKKMQSLEEVISEVKKMLEANEEKEQDDESKNKKENEQQEDETKKEIEEMKEELEKMKEEMRKKELNAYVENKKINENIKNFLKKNIEKGLIKESKDIDEILKELDFGGASKVDIEVKKEYNDINKLMMGLRKALNDEPSNEEEKKMWESVEPIGIRDFFEEVLDKQSWRRMKEGRIAGLRLKEDVRRITEDLDTSTVPEFFGQIINTVLKKAYGRVTLGEEILQICKITSLTDLRERKVINLGGFDADLPEVNEGSTYTDFNGTPTKETAKYTPKKRGQILKITWEMIQQDQTGLVRRLIEEYARMAKLSLIRYIHDLLINYDATTGNVNGGVIYDGFALYDDANHKNLLADNLSYVALQQAKLKMRKQTRAGETAPIGIAPKFLIVPPELESAAWRLVANETRADGNNNELNEFYKQLTVIVSGYLRDDNNWYVVADPRMIEGLEIGFWKGKQQPELIVSDRATDYDMFYSDSIPYKLRHIYGGAITDYRAFVGSIVA